jgi:hypothetical protein
MQHDLREFLRHGGSGQYVFAQQNGGVYGYRAGISIKSLFPGYAELRADFTDQLDRVIADNARMLLNALTPPDTVPWVTEADLRDVSDAKEEALRQWDARLTASPGTPNDVTLVDYTPTAGGYPLQDLAEHEAGGGHTIELHVGKSEAFLIGMVTVPQARTLFYTVYRWRHGSFSSLAAAERLTNANLSRNADIVNAVATGREEDAFITSTFSSITGQEAYRLTRRASSPIRLRTTYGVGTYIRHAPDMPNGFIIITSYPRDE